MLQEMEVDEQGMTPEEQFGASKSAAGEWASCIQVVEPKLMSVLHTVHMGEQEGAVSLCLASFGYQSEEQSFLVVGTVQRLRFCPMESDGG